MGEIRKNLGAIHQDLQKMMGRRVTLEACENIHFHWRNVRIEMGPADFMRFLDVAGWAHRQFLDFVRGKVVHLPVASICPWDTTHHKVGDGFGCIYAPDHSKNEWYTAKHRESIDWFKAQIGAGKQPWPIAVRAAWHGGQRFSRPQDKIPGNVFQRLDGFARYMAHAELKLPLIQSFIWHEDRPGCQDGLKTPLRFPGDGLQEAFGKHRFANLGEEALTDGMLERQRGVDNGCELLVNGSYHVHMGDTRLEFTPEAFETFTKLIAEARTRR